MIEKHPFKSFQPPNSRYLILGSFTGKRTSKEIDEGYDWYYGTKRNLFWPILEQVYDVNLKSKKVKVELFERLGIAIADIIKSCQRKSNSNLDINLTNIILNEDIGKILKNTKVDKVFFSSKFVEKLFRKYFKQLIQDYQQIEFITLPSPSPRFAAMNKTEKVILYKKLLPVLH